MKPKDHYFTLIVKTNASRKAAESAILFAFATRKPDNCEFDLQKDNTHKEIWMAGARAGTETVFDLVALQLQKLRDTCTETPSTGKRKLSKEKRLAHMAKERVM